MAIPKTPTLPLARLLGSVGAEAVAERAVGADLEQRHLLLDSGGRIEYDQLVVATGAMADHGRVPGSHEHALFPCDLDDAAAFARRVSAGIGHVALVFGWERPGPGLEYAAWIAARRPGVRVTAIDGDETMARRFGDKVTAWIAALFERRGSQLVTQGAVERIGEGIVKLEGSTISAELIAVVAPLRGNTEWLPRALLDERGMLRVDGAMAG